MTKLRKWMCVVNLSGIHGPLPATKGDDGCWLDVRGNFDFKPGRRGRNVKDGCRVYLYDTEEEARAWLEGARAVANQVRSLCK